MSRRWSIVFRKIVIGLLVVAAGVIGLGFYLGWFDWQSVRDRATDEDTWSDLKTRAQQEEVKLKAKMGELTGESTSGAAQPAQVCRGNLRRIESAKRAVAGRTGVSVGAVSWDDVVKEMGGQMPRCPAGGDYSLGALGQLPRCSIGAAGTPDPKDDHAIQAY